ncbi:UNVERIFIED_CONTAM: hypothetical protein Sradi_0659200 [Sesamum radiatum]|uniref:Uncharacterized protein n=1 Tax=Sesamum radiatum TaxID=300843 RepID=A0AAW2VLG5_SESRA
MAEIGRTDKLHRRKKPEIEEQRGEQQTPGQEGQSSSQLISNAHLSHAERVSRRKQKISHASSRHRSSQGQK